MPTYDYACEEGSHRFELFQRFSEEPLSECRICGAPVRRVLHPVGIIFKGGGWYATENRPTEEKSRYSKDGHGETSKPAPSTEPSAEPIAASNGGSDGGDAKIAPTGEKKAV